MSFDKTIIAENFSRGAKKYDDLAQVQKMAAQKLVALTFPFIKPNSQILDLGSGTSFIAKEIIDLFQNPTFQRPSVGSAVCLSRSMYDQYTPSLRASTPPAGSLEAGFEKGLIKTDIHSKIFEVDISSEMLGSWHDRPSNVIPIQTDMENLPQNFPFESNFFDVIFSSFALHWVCDFKKIFTRLFLLLKPGGVLAICLPCHPSLDELRSVFYINHFPDNNDLESLFQQLKFEKKIFSNKAIKQFFPNQLAALKFIKEIGANYPSNNLKTNKNFRLKNFISGNKNFFLSWKISYFIVAKP